MELQGFVPYESNAARPITSKDKFLFVVDGRERVVDILLTRRNSLVCRAEGAVAKFELMFTVWTQEDGMPLIHNGGQLYLWVPRPVPAPVAIERRKAPRPPLACGESKIAKCRAIYAEAPTLDKVAMIKRFVDEAGCTPLGAVTYYLTCKKG